MRFISRQEDKINLKKRNPGPSSSSHSPGRLSIVGIGPGAIGHLSQKAYKAILECEVIVGYNTYIRLLGDLVSAKKVIASGMNQEIKRGKQAIEKALAGKKVCIISSGDPGVYGMAGVVLELLKNNDALRIKIEIIPGIMAASGCASLLGAPLAHDFVVISLSDLLTNIQEIEEKLIAAAKADFVIVLYNPKSKNRIKPLERAWEILLKYRPPQTVVGMVKKAFRLGEKVKITRLKHAPLLKDIDMATTIIVGNSKTYIKNGYMITSRGYNFTLSTA